MGRPVLGPADAAEVDSVEQHASCVASLSMVIVEGAMWAASRPWRGRRRCYGVATAALHSRSRRSA